MTDPNHTLEALRRINEARLECDAEEQAHAEERERSTDYIDPITFTQRDYYDRAMVKVTEDMKEGLIYDVDAVSIAGEIGRLYKQVHTTFVH